MKLISIFFLLMTSFMSLSAWSQTVTNVKGQKALLNLNGESWSVGDKVFAMDAQGKKRALLQIKQVKNGRAVADVIKGQAQNGMTLVMGKKSSGSSDSGGSSIARGMRAGSAYGFTVAAMMNTMKISNYLNGGTSYAFDMVGTNFGAGGFYDYPLTSSWFVRGNGTIEMFDVLKKASTPICKNGTSTKCTATFTQMGLYGTFNYVFSPAPFRVWAGGGGGAVIYLAKESTVLNTSKFFFNTILMAAGGFDYFLSHNTFMPVSFEYQTIPDKEASVTSLVLRVGWGKNF